MPSDTDPGPAEPTPTPGLGAQAAEVQNGPNTGTGDPDLNRPATDSTEATVKDPTEVTATSMPTNEDSGEAGPAMSSDPPGPTSLGTVIPSEPEKHVVEVGD